MHACIHTYIHTLYYITLHYINTYIHTYIHTLKEQLHEDEPPVATVMRDLGIDHQAGRRRRIPVLKQRFRKAQQRKIKLRNLKIPALKFACDCIEVAFNQ